MSGNKLLLALASLAIAFTVATAEAKTLKIAGAADIPTLDPHGKSDNNTLSFLGNIYEGLVRRDAALKLQPALAVSWSHPSELVYRFKLRPNVKFHDGSALAAADVVFSFERAVKPRSEVRTIFASFKSARAIDPLTVEVETKWPDPLLVERTYAVPIMSKAWAEKHNAVDPVDMNANATANGAHRGAMGTGPFMLKSHQPGRSTVAVVNPNWWDKKASNLTEVTYVPIPNAGTRTAALLSGEIDLNYDLSIQDMARVRATPGLKVVAGPEIRTIFLALDQSRDELLESNVKGKNPFKDIRVRKAVYQAIDIEAIRKHVMHGLSRPNALMWAERVNGYDKALDKRFPYDPAAAKKLLAAAGYPNGFEVGFDCPNDRYLNDEETCKAITSMLARVGIKATLNAMPRGKWFAKLLPDYKISMTLAGWFPLGVYDAAHTLTGVMSCRNRQQGRGIFNLGGYCNPKLDEVIKASEREFDPTKRLALLREAARIHRDDIGHIPLHDSFIAWGMKAKVDVVQTADNILLWRYVTVK
ncbi:MAG: ABC transporter substrate-binding protein [Rhodospirillaceae bacterium]|nr:ABC transporter substrate-binding protein [Rhodospirillaceae bacterium]